MQSDFTITTDEYERTVAYTDSDEEQFVDVEVTGKEAVDVLKAVEQLALDVDADRFETDLPVQETLNIARGGIHFPDECSVLFTSDEHAQVMMHALARYEPTDSDFTGRLQTAFLTALEEAPITFDLNALQEITSEQK